MGSPGGEVVSVDTRQKIEVLGRSAQYDLCGEACGTEANRVRDDLGRWIYPAVLPDGKRINLLKILLTNACENDCYYCANRASRNFRRLSFTPEELAYAFDQMHRKGLVKGLFLSSGVCNAGRTMDRMIATVELVRQRYAFPGYVHLKILPGATFAHVERAVQLANRVSVNLEAPNPERLARIAPPKDFTTHLLQPLQWANRLIEEESQGRRASVSQTTQFVVGASGETDRELLSTTARLYREVDLARVYFSAFQPIVDTPLEDHPPTPPLREHRLYQSDFLFRQYGFTFEDLVFDDSGNLPTEADPKLMWAQAHPECFPVEVNRASREELLRVPGIGPTSASRILKLRGKGEFCELSDLCKIGTVSKRAAPFILLKGKPPPFQLSLW
jgi:putative DNA modification/repair radical SAM protein